MATPVVFRTWLDVKPAACIAFLPELKAKERGMLASYELECGLSDASHTCYKEKTRPATARERKALEQELRQKYGDIEVLTHLPRA